MLNATTAEKAVVFSYMMTGSSSVSLEVEHKTEFAGWSTLFSESGDTGEAWKGAAIRVPEGTVGLRLLASAGVGAVVKVDSILAVERADWDSIGCTFEVDFCGWSRGFENQWRAQRGPTASSSTGPPEGAFEGNRYIYTEATRALNKAGIVGCCSLELCARIQFTCMAGPRTERNQVLIGSCQATDVFLKGY